MTLYYIEKPNGKPYYCYIDYLKKPKDDAYHTSLDSKNNTNKSEPAQNDSIQHNTTVHALTQNHYFLGGIW